MTDIEELRPGDRVVCTGELNDGFLGMNSELIGVEGTVWGVGQFESQITSWVGVKWDNGSSLNLLTGDPVRLVAFDIAGPVVGPCEVCGAFGDVECEPTCENKDFRDAEFEGVLEQP